MRRIVAPLFALVTGFAAFALPIAAQAADPCSNHGALDPMYCDDNRDLVADPPKDRARWKRVMKTDPGEGKAAARRGACPRCDTVPAGDRSPERFARFDDHILEAAALYQIPVPLIRAVIHVESSYDPRVVSSAGARGLMQLMPAAASDMGVRNVHDPRDNILGGTRLLRVLAGTDGPFHNVIKIRGPMPLTDRDADCVVDVLDGALGELT